MNVKRLWIGFFLVMVLSFGVLGHFGRALFT